MITEGIDIYAYFMYNASINTFTTTNSAYKENISVMANNHDQPTTAFGLFERFKKPIAGIALTMGVLSVSACNEVASADKAPTTASSSATPGATETPSPENSSETTKPSAEALDGVDVSNLGPAAKARVAELTPENIVKMSEAERIKAFSISLADVEGATNSKTAAENYAELSFAIVSSMLRAGCTPEDIANFKNTGASTYRDFNRTTLLEPTLLETFGEKAGPASTLANFSFAKRCFDQMSWIPAVRDLAKGNPSDAAYGQLKGNKDVASINDYSLVFKYDPSSLKVITDGSGKFGDALSVAYSFGFKETNKYTPKQLEAITMVGGNPADYVTLEGSIKLQIEGVADKSDGDKLTSSTAYAKMTSNQSADGTIS